MNTCWNCKHLGFNGRVDELWCYLKDRKVLASYAVGIKCKEHELKDKL